MQRLEVSVRLELADALPPVLVDRIGIEQVLAKLLRNEADAMAGQPGMPVIDVHSHPMAPMAAEPAGVQVTVCDRGPGLQGRSLDELCATFFTAKRDDKLGVDSAAGVATTLAEMRADGSELSE